MEVVFFPEEMHARAPTALGVLCDAATNDWLTLLDVAARVRAGETVTIRPASEMELQRAEGYVVLYEIGVQLGIQLGALLDHEPPDEAARKREVVQEAIRSIDVELSPIVAQNMGPGALAADAATPMQTDTADEIPDFCAALQRAYAAGDKVTAWRLRSLVTSRLLESLMGVPAAGQDAPSLA